MKQLTCEMCGSTDMVKQDGVFVCQTCGCKYSVEEAKKMMVEGVVEVAGTVKVDNTDNVKTYLEMANSAYAAGNQSEAETYCNRIIEIEPQNYEAWLLKGKAAGWQSSLSNNRIDETIHCFKKAIMFAPEEAEDHNINIEGQDLEFSIIPKKFITNTAFEELQNISIALIKLSGDNFIKWPDKDEQIATNNIFVDCVTKLQEFSSDVEYDKTLGEQIKPLVEIVNSIAITAYNSTALKDYNNADPLPNKYEWEQFCTRADNAISLLDQANNAVQLAPVGLEKVAIRIIDNMITIHRNINDSCSWDSDYIDYCRDMPGGYERVVAKIKASGGIPDPSNDRYWHRKFGFTDSAKASRNNIIKALQGLKKAYQEMLNKREEVERNKKAEEQKKQNEAYWSEHSEEKQKLESERDSLQNEVNQLQEQVNQINNEIYSWTRKRKSEVPSSEEKKTVEKQISMLQQELDSLGMFKGKQKKELQAQIDELKSRRSALRQTIETEEAEQIKNCNAKIRECEERAKPIKEKIDSIQKRIDEIQTELTKDR